MNDDDLIDGFAAGTVAAGEFHHRDHVRLTWLYLARYGRAEAQRRLAIGLHALAVRAGKPDKFDASLTRAWIEAIDAARQAHPAATFDALVTAHPELLDHRAIKANR